MVVHKVQVVFGEIRLPLWYISDDHSFYLGLYSGLYDDLKTPATHPHTRYSIRAVIRGGEQVIDVHDDASLMRVFAANKNCDDVIMFDVKAIVDLPLQVEDPNVSSDDHEMSDNDDIESTENVTEDDSQHSDDDSLDPEWRNGQDYSSEDASSESIGDILTDSDNEHLINREMDSDIEGSEEEYEEAYRRPRREGDPIHPNSNVPRVPNPATEGGRIVLRQWQVFDDFKHFNAVLKDYCIQEGFELKRKKYERARVTYICKVEGCPWRIHASMAPDKLSFMIKTFNNEHTCTQVRSNAVATPNWLANHLLESFKIHPDMDINAMRAEIKNRFGLDIDNRRLWRARVKAKAMNEGSHVESFKLLRSYALMVLKTNPNSVAIINSEIDGNPEDPNVEPPRFKRIFICFDGVKQGFIQGCRPFFGLDGCHLKGPYKGVLLAALGVDGNLQFFPLAFAIAETENKESWEWFITLLKESIGETYNDIPWTIMSDRQKGLIYAAPLMPGLKHRYCAYHLKNNFRKLWGDEELKNKFWKAARTANYNEFQHIMRDIRNQNKDAFEWLSLIEPKHWTRSKFDHNSKVEHITNNFVESFNDWLDDLRSQPPIPLLEGIRVNISDLMYIRKTAAQRWNKRLTPKVLARIKELRKKSRYAVCRRVGTYEFQVDYDVATYVVKLDEKICVCEQWQVRGIPCLHALACIDTIRGDVADYTDGFFTTEMWRKTYSTCIHPIPSKTMWDPMDGIELRPPKLKKLPGRPKKRRRRSADERPPSAQPAVKKCGLCGEHGHNRTSCTSRPGLGHNVSMEAGPSSRAP